jgi:mono/diheme cytochrome c family protein
MNAIVLLGVVAALAGLRFARPNMLLWVLAWWAAVYVATRFGIVPPLPSSIIVLFMSIVTGALLTYVFSDSQRLESAKRPLAAFLVERKYTVPLIIVAGLLPLLVATKVYLGLSKEVLPPLSSRTIHPAPPESITFKGKRIDLIAGVNPYRVLEGGAPDSFAVHVANGRRVYYQNCVFCHGDHMEGDGIYAHALDPIPANFADPTTIAMLQETYLFWRIAKGGPGLPEESTPWSSAMPAWEQFLTEDEIWDVILFLYEYTGHKPRAREAGE